jgi:hypothetical protein
MKNQDKHINEKMRELLNYSGIEKTKTDFTRRVMDKVDKEKRMYPYKRDNTFMHILLAVGLPVIYFIFQALTGNEGFLAGLDITMEFQPYINLFRLLADKLVMDVSTPIVPLGMLAIVLLLLFDRFVLRMYSFK